MLFIHCRNSGSQLVILLRQLCLVITFLSWNDFRNPRADILFSQTNISTKKMFSNYHPDVSPSINPDLSPSINPDLSPSINPDLSPSINPDLSPSINPDLSPSINPDLSPSINPDLSPSINPDLSPSINPNGIRFQLVSKLRNGVTSAVKLQNNDRKPRLKQWRERSVINHQRSSPSFDKVPSNKTKVSLINVQTLKNMKVKRHAGYIEDTSLDRLHASQDLINSTIMSRSSTKREQKNKRFLSNVKSSLETHIKQGKKMWKMSKNEIKKTFDKYYECTEKRLASLKKEDFPIKALLLVEGENVQMPCTICYRPDQSEESQKAIWQVLRHETSTLEDVYSDKRISLSNDHTLHIEAIDIGDAGQYFCVEKHDYAAVYQVDVFLTDRRRNVRLGEDELMPDTFLIKHNLHVFTMWSSWEECNTCGERTGQMPRIGQCSVKKIYPDIPVFPRDYPLMNLYPEGVPCHSTALPRHIRKLSEIGLRDSETLVRPCKEICPTDPPMTIITDETKQIVEIVEPGYHSMKHQPPVLPSLVKRKVLYEPEKSHLVLHCPTTSKPSLIHWAREDRDVDPSEVKKLTKGRVWVDSLSRLHLNPLLLSDTAVYNCWSKNVRVASIKLIVVNQGNQNMKYYISYVGLACTVIGSLVCMFCICCKKSDKNAQ